MRNFKDIDEYILEFPDEIKTILEKIRRTIQAAAPQAVEGISYGMPVFKQKGNLVYFAAYKKHIGFYPAPSGIEAFEDELTKYKTGKGTLQFPLKNPIPYELISRIVHFRVIENIEKARANTDK
jgi:uncharacterized protein YdhG (YjbR/CyaY superfamily)